jgi:biopolymer transport protein ExbD
MAMSTGGGGGVQSEPNVTPMIDVLLVLLIIFMVVQAMSRVVMKVQVPPPTTAAAKGPSDQIVLEIKDDGTYAINGTAVPQDQLGAQIHSIFDPRPVKLLFVKPGPNRIYQDVIDAMDVARSSGVEVIGFTPADTRSTAS